ncbi:UvrD-helicase domain-containing protein [Planococcus sp. SIMBA_143]
MVNMKSYEKNLGSSSNIEKVLAETYIENPEELKILSIEKHDFATNGVPILVTRLHRQITELERLPSVSEFMDYYADYTLEKRNSSLAKREFLRYAAFKGYLGLVRDLHFFLVLKESELFEDVILDEELDLYGKMDIIVRNQGTTMGIQLFAGGKSDIDEKLKNANRMKTIQSGFEDYYFPLYNDYVSTQRIELKSGRSIELYSHEAARHIAQVMISENPYKYSAPIDPPKYVVPDIPVHNPAGDSAEWDISHSLLFAGELEMFKSRYDIVSLLAKGITVHLLCEEELGIEHPSLNMHVLAAIPEQVIIIDGVFETGTYNRLEHLGMTSTFNHQQYIIEHAPLNNHLIVNAGAGSGKTTTMVSRIMFLLNTDDSINPEDIVMITFTREAADNMRKKIMEALEIRFRSTKDDKYLTWLERAMEMRIMTIDAFSRYLFQSVGSIDGWGQDVKVTSYIYKREEIFREEFSRFLNGCTEKDYNHLLELKDYDLFKFFAQIYEEIEKKGHSLGKHYLQWDASQDNLRLATLVRTAKSVIPNTHKRMETKKLESNEATLADLKRKVGELRDNLELGRLDHPIKYLFVDEFQDTDDAQIDLVSTIVEKLGARLFAVGDIKQSIYRFRGANSTAFRVIEDKLGKANIDTSSFALNTNYRTDGHLLDWMEDIFDSWRTGKERYLPQEVDSKGRNIGRLTPYKKKASSKTDPLHRVKHSKLKAFLEEHIESLYRDLWEGHEPKKRGDIRSLAILVRENWQVKEIGGILEKMRLKEGSSESITYELSVDGNLFASKSAKDLLILINALRLEDNPEGYFALLQTPFTAGDFDLTQLVPLEGDKEKLLEAIQQFFRDVGADWIFDAQRELRFEPAMKVLYNILMKVEIEGNLEGVEQSHEIIRYRKNLSKLLSEAHKTLGQGADDIQLLYEWLKIQVATNRNTDEADIMENLDKDIIRVMTVHKAKGLEFHTVLLPYTGLPFIKSNDQKNKVIIHDGEQSDKPKVTLKYNWQGVTEPLLTDEFESADQLEVTETVREEARLLYVAMTRAEKKLSVILPGIRKKSLCWADLLERSDGR